MCVPRSGSDWEVVRKIQERFGSDWGAVGKRLESGWPFGGGLRWGRVESGGRVGLTSGNAKLARFIIYMVPPPPGIYLFEKFTGICSVFYPFLGFGESNEKEAFPRTFWKLQA